MEAQNLELIECRTSFFCQSLLSLGSFLDRIFVFLAVCRPAFTPFEGDVLVGEVYADEGDADGIGFPTFGISPYAFLSSPERDRLKKPICSREAKELWIQVEKLHRPTNDTDSIADHAFCDRIAVKQ